MRPSQSPNVVTKRQEGYRHIDYVQFMSNGQIQDLIQHSLPRRHQEQRAAFLFGYYVQDPHQKGGIRVIVQALYGPLQKSNHNGFQILQHEESPQQQYRVPRTLVHFLTQCLKSLLDTSHHSNSCLCSSVRETFTQGLKEFQASSTVKFPRLLSNGNDK